MASHFFTSRYGGVSAGLYQHNNLARHVGDEVGSVDENRMRLESVVGDVAYMNQSHGDNVSFLERIPEVEPDADAMITTSPGISLAVLTADCIPLLLWDENSRCVAAVHVGRRGLMNGVAIKTLEKMRTLGSQNIRGVLGPSICAKCYEVGEDVFDEVIRVFPKANSHFGDGRFFLDLAGALQDQLEKSGVTSVKALSCTFEDSSFFSYRRDGITGRFAGVVTL
jgi:YfiH family protein